jgi:LacI family transcriptional regulator
MRRIPRVILLIETSKAVGRGILSGVRRYIREHQPWSAWVEERGIDDPDPPWLKAWLGDGVLSRSRDDSPVIKTLLKRSIPVVQLRPTLLQLPLPRVYTNHRAVGRLAAEHLLNRGLRSFGYYGLTARPWTHEHLEGFREVLRKAGHSCKVLHRQRMSKTAGWQREMDSILNWLRELPKPVGVMASHDEAALKVLAACSWACIPVPEDVAVIGVDNDELLCDLADPPLTSVAHDLERIGYEAAELLQRMMKGEHVPPEPRYLQPLGVVQRQSTELLAIDDRVVAEACRIIRQRACQGLTVEQLVSELPVSRRSLERRFENAFARGPKQEIRRVQLERAAQLLSTTDLKLARIAQLAGFEYQEHLYRLFKQWAKRTPQQYRESFRHGHA